MQTLARIGADDGRSPHRSGWRFPARARATARLGRIRWRRSLLVRVVAATVALGLIVVLVVGQFLLQRISNGLVDSRMAAVQAESKLGLDQVKENFAKNNFKDVDFLTFVNDQIDQLQGPADRPTRYVLLKHAKSEAEVAPIADRASSTQIEATSIPDDLRNEVNSDPAEQHAQLLSLPVQLDGSRTDLMRAIAVGGLVDFGPINGGRYELYFIYGLEPQ